MVLRKKKYVVPVGEAYVGPACWSDDYTVVPKPGYYALSEDGKALLVDVPLVCIDDAPGDPEDGSCHYVYAGENEYPQKTAEGKEIPYGHPVDLEFEVEGETTFV